MVMHGNMCVFQYIEFNKQKEGILFLSLHMYARVNICCQFNFHSTSKQYYVNLAALP